MRKSPGQEPSTGVLQSADHALRLVLLVAQRGSVTLSEVAAELGVGASTAHRLLRTCKHVGFVRQDRPGAPYITGPAVLELSLATTAAISLRDAADPVLRELAAQAGETAGLVVLEGPRIRFVSCLEGRGRDRVASRVGVVLPAHRTAGGRAMLACYDEEELRRRIPGPLLSEDGADWPGLLRDLERIRKRGWAAAFGDSDRGVAAIGACVRTGTGEPRAAVTLAVPRARMSTGREASAMAPMVAAAAERIERRLRGASA
ncbi:IclR family transcriptional regulator [Streptomyces sp. NPDC055400]